MSFNSFGHMFRVTTFGESHGPALGCVVDGCPPGIPLTEADIQGDLDRRRPGPADYTYWAKYGVRDYKGSGRVSARETASHVAAGAIARKIVSTLYGKVTVRGALVSMGTQGIDRKNFDSAEVAQNDFF